MILRRVIDHFRKQEWTAIAIDFVIVVAGVFIGIQVSNWNAERSLEEREKVYLQQLLIDLESDMATGERGVVAADNIDAAADSLLAVLEGEDSAAPVSDAELVRSVTLAGYAYLPQVNATTYNEMISTGALGLLRSAELKRALGEYYAGYSAGRQWDSLLREEQFAYLAAVRGLLTRKQFVWARANAGTSKEALPPPPTFDRPAFLEEARGRPEIIDSLRSMGALQERLRDDSRDLSARADALAGRIMVELE